MKRNITEAVTHFASKTKQRICTGFAGVKTMRANHKKGRVKNTLTGRAYVILGCQQAKKPVTHLITIKNRCFN